MTVKQIINIAAAATTAASDTRHMDPTEAVSHIGRMNVAAISGGRVHTVNTSVVMPVSSGYHVVVSLNYNDTYNVRRVFVRNGSASVKEQWIGVYADQVGEVAYTASCYR